MKLVLKAAECESGCHVRRLHASSAALIDSRREYVDPLVEVVGLDSMLPDGENDPIFEAFICPKTGGPYVFP